MNVGDLLAKKETRGVITIGSQASVQSAIGRLVEHNIGSLVVVGDDDRPTGIITERDVLRCCASDSRPPDDIQVEEFMSSDLIVGEMDDSIDYVMGIMTRNRIRHLPVMGSAGLEGMISIGDVVESQLQRTEYENRHLKQYIRGQY
jgi:signal-transduction protein with cAMP-binding, CBS, and nucleotidyltransferase domain